MEVSFFPKESIFVREKRKCTELGGREVNRINLTFNSSQTNRRNIKKAIGVPFFFCTLCVLKLQHPSIHQHLSYAGCMKGRGGVGGGSGACPSCHWDKLLLHFLSALTQTAIHFHSEQFKWMSLDRGREPEYSEGTHTDTGRTPGSTGH